MSTKVEISALIGKTFDSVFQSFDADSDEIVFKSENGPSYRMVHIRDCCESVSIEDVCGSLSDLSGSPIIEAREDTNQDNPKHLSESHTWTFYNIATEKGWVTIRWYGESNGYYSESVDLVEI